MPYKEKESFKLYYSIGEVADILKVTPSLLRFWEKQFDTIKPQKNKKGNRIYTAHDLEQLKLIHHLVKEQGYTLEGAKQKIKHTSDMASKAEVIDLLKNIRDRIRDLKDSL
ncbi:MAG: MerR family transcriptional regulator [Salibacteraceae bacterium]